ncbi:MAG TPA: protein kinase [Kofleriaceae bacterium]
MANRRVARGTDNNGLLLSNLVAGTRLGEFVIEDRLGTRGTGQLYSATHLVLPRRATILVLPAAEGGVKSVALDLLREACIVDAVDHPGMPRVFECGMLSDRRPWLATERIEGKTVADLIEARDVSMTEAIAIVRDVADILAESHRRGLVHCNVTPASIVIPAHPRRFPLCLVDWVGARTHDSNAPLPMVVGSRYVAPEQANAVNVDARSDVYSLGMIARELVESTGEVVPPMFAALLGSMIAFDPTVRPSSIEVRNTATWLTNELAPEAALADDGNDWGELSMDDATVTTADSGTNSAPITSEIAAAVAGEITPRS